MTTALAKHGTERGYRAENATGKFCDRCRAAHRVYASQFTKTNKAKGVRYTTQQVIDHLDVGPYGARRAARREELAQAGIDTTGTPMAAEASPSLSERFGGVLASLTTSSAQEEYVAEDDEHGYIKPIESDAPPQFSEISDDDWEADVIINEAGLKKISENLGFYVVTVGMTLEMIDPYCGKILASNADEMIQNWAKVIAHYPGIAKYFISQKGGVIFAWINALQSTWPFLKAIYDHHLGGNIKVEDGVAYRNVRGAKKVPVMDPTMPPVPDTYNYSAG